MKSIFDLLIFSFKREAYLIAAISFLPLIAGLIVSAVYLLLK